MDILYSSSDSYAFLTGISILSLLENNKAAKEINLYIMDNYITDENKGKLREVVERYGRKIQFFAMPDMKAKTGMDINTRRWNISTFGRLYMAGVLPETVHKVLNIDCDTIIEDSLEELWETDLTGKVVGGMLECINDRYRHNVGMKDGEFYLNGGIIFLNLDEVRKHDYERKFTDYIVKYGDSLAYLDQDVINGTVPQDKKVKLPIRHNMLSPYFYVNYEQMLTMRRSRSFYSKKEYEDGVKKPGLVHFTTCYLDGLRPWIKGNKHPYLQEFLRYKEMSPWKDVPLQEDNRKFVKRIESKLIRSTPKFIIFRIASVLHGVVVPYRNRKKMLKTGLNKSEGKKWSQ